MAIPLIGFPFVGDTNGCRFNFGDVIRFLVLIVDDHREGLNLFRAKDRQLVPFDFSIGVLSPVDKGGAKFSNGERTMGFVPRAFDVGF